MSDPDTARLLVEQALHLCQHGERAPGAGPWPAETWPEWARRAEVWLQSEPVSEPVDVDRLVTQELVQQVARALSMCATGRGYRLHDERFHLARAALCSVAADLYRVPAVRGPVGVAGLVTDEMVERAARAECTEPPPEYPCSFCIATARRILSSVVADLYERGREDGRGDLIWHEQRVRRECAEELRAVSQPAHPAHLIDTDTLLALAAEWAGPEETP